MSSSYASNTVNDGVEISVNVLNEATQNCQTQVLESQDIVIKDIKNSTVNIGDINWSEVITLNDKCTQNSTTQTSISNSLEQTISQISKAVGQAFSIPGNTAQSSNNTKLWTDIGTTIQNVYNQKCKQLLIEQQTFILEDVTNSRIDIANINWSESTNAMIACVQTDESVTSVKNKIVQNIEQKATAVIESLLSGLFTIILIIIVIVGVIILGGGKALTDWRFILVIAGIIILYLGLALWRKWFPFK